MLPEDILVSIAKVLPNENLHEALGLPRIADDLSVECDDNEVEDSVLQAALNLEASRTHFLNLKLKCKSIGTSRCSFQNVSFGHVDEFRVCSPLQFENVQFQSVKVLHLWEVHLRKSQWTFGPLEEFWLDPQTTLEDVFQTKLLFLSLRATQSFEFLKTLKDSVFEEFFACFHLDTRIETFLTECVLWGIQFPCHTVNLSRGRQYVPDQTFFRLLMRVFPNLREFHASACNWSPSMSESFESELRKQPQIVKVNLSENYAIETWNGPPLQEFSALGLFRSNWSHVFETMLTWPLKALDCDLTENALDAFFRLLEKPLDFLQVNLDMIQTSLPFLEMSKTKIKSVQCRKIVFRTSLIQKAAFSWFRELKLIWARCSGTVQVR